MTILIFEGPDRSGKTTIAEAVAERLGTEVFMTNSKESFTDKSVFSEDSSPIAIFNYHIAKYLKHLEYMNKLDKTIIIYRSFLSEMVYSSLLGRVTDNVINDMTDSIYANLDATIVYLQNSTPRDYKDDTLDNETIERSMKLYEHYKKKVRCDMIEFDTKDHDIEAYVDSIVGYALRKKHNMVKN